MNELSRQQENDERKESRARDRLHVDSREIDESSRKKSQLLRVDCFGYLVDYLFDIHGVDRR